MKPIPARALSDGVRAMTAALSDDLAREVMKAVKPVSARIAKALRDGDFQTAQREARSLRFEEGLAKTSKRVRRFTRSAALIGAGAVDRPQTSLWGSGAPYPWEVDTGAVRLLQASAARMLEDTQRKVEALVVRASRFQKDDRLVKAAEIDPDKLANDINRYLRGEIRRVVDVSANVVGTRVSAYGMYHEARVRGIAQYRIDAIIDDRTTEICKAMDGRIFQVEEAFTRTGQALSAADPEAQKRIAPFPPSAAEEIESLKRLDAADLQARGFDTPPFHFLCRSVVTLVTADLSYDPVAWSNYPDEAEAVKQEKLLTPKWDRVARSVWRDDDLDALKQRALNMTAREAGKEEPLADVVYYTGHNYTEINTTLRKNYAINAGSNLRAVIDNIDKAIAASSAPDVTYVYRGIKRSEAERMVVGKVFQDDAFMSTSISIDTAANFAGASEGAAILHIQIGTGQKALPVWNTSLFDNEKEILLPRGSQLRIVGDATYTVNGDRVRVIRAVLQGQGEILSPDDIGNVPLPEAVSVIKAEDRLTSKFVYELGDLREASFLG